MDNLDLIIDSKKGVNNLTYALFNFKEETLKAIFFKTTNLLAKIFIKIFDATLILQVVQYAAMLGYR